MAMNISMNVKEAKRRGMMPKTASYGKSEMFTSPDISSKQRNRYMVGDIMFGGLAGANTMNWYGNEPESTMTGGVNMKVNGLYGVGGVSDYMNQDFALGFGTMATMGAIALFLLKYRGQI